jgi:hypothetical protein
LLGMACICMKIHDYEHHIYTRFLSACLRRLERRLGAYVVGTGKSRRAKERLDV